MALIRLEKVTFKVDLGNLRREAALFLKDIGKLYSKALGYSFNLKAVPVEADGKCYVIGEVVKTETKKKICDIYGTLGEMHTEPKFQTVSLQRRRYSGNWLDPETFKQLDGYLASLLKLMFTTAMGLTPEDFEFGEPTPLPDESWSISATEKPKWGEQSCEKFTWSDAAKAVMAKGVNLHKWCSRCGLLKVKNIVCNLAMQIAANRKNKNQLSLGLENKTYYCVVCGNVPVDAQNGFDTCPNCVKAV